MLQFFLGIIIFKNYAITWIGLGTPLVRIYLKE